MLESLNLTSIIIAVGNYNFTRNASMDYILVSVYSTPLFSCLLCQKKGVAEEASDGGDVQREEGRVYNVLPPESG